MLHLIASAIQSHAPGNGGRKYVCAFEKNFIVSQALRVYPCYQAEAVTFNWVIAEPLRRVNANFAVGRTYNNVTSFLVNTIESYGRTFAQN